MATKSLHWSSFPLTLAFLFLALSITSCDGPTPTPEDGVSGHAWFVATTGEDTELCGEVSDRPCLTINYTIDKASEGDTIHVAAGTYQEYPFARGNAQAVYINGKSISIIGAGSENTFIEGRSDVIGHGVRVSNAHISLADLTLQNASREAYYAALYLEINASATLENVTVRNSYYGINVSHQSTGPLTLTNVTVTGNANTGVVAIEAITTIEGGEFSGNRNGLSLTGTVTIQGSTIQDNAYTGAAIGGTATLTDVNITNNGNVEFGNPGLDVACGRVTVTGGEIHSNAKTGVWVRCTSADLIMRGTSIHDNLGTGFSVREGRADLTNVTIANNGLTYTSTGIPAAISNKAFLVIRNSSLLSNHNGGIANYAGAELFVIESRIEGNLGGFPAIYNEEGAAVVMERSLIANNIISPISISDAAVENRGSMNFLNSTISGNTGSGVHAAGGSLTLAYVTIAENESYGLFGRPSAGVVTGIINTLIAKNSERDCNISSPPSGTFPLVGNNIDTDGTCNFPETYPPDEILLGPLADNGEPTYTHALEPGSPAIDVATGSCPETDQRLVGRPISIACDVGAYEAPVVPLSLADSGVALITDTPTPPGQQPGGPTGLVVKRDTPCLGGPGPGYPFYTTLLQGTRTDVVGYAFGGGWLVAEHPTIVGVRCWLDEDDVTPDQPTSDMRLISNPPLPTHTPTPVKEGRPQDPPPTCDPQYPPCP